MSGPSLDKQCRPTRISRLATILFHKRTRRILTVGAIIVLAGGWTAYRRYPGFCTAFGNHLKHTSPSESRNLYGCVSYWLEFMEHLSLNPATGKYDFERALQEHDAVDPFTLGKLNYHRGDFDEAVRLISSAIADDGENEDRLFWLAMSHLRQAEANNCLHALTRGPASDSPPLVCTLPISCCHARPEHTGDAAELFLRLLEKYDSENRLYRWLLNFCHMATGDFPGGVPEPYRVDGHFVDSFYGSLAAAGRETFGNLRFRDEAKRLGIDTLDTGRGVAVEDFDRDGYLDIVTGGSFHDLKFYRNVRGERFDNTTAEMGLATVAQPFCISAADYDNDGWIDLFVARPFDRYRLFRNESGKFRDVTRETGLLAVLQESEIAATWISTWADVDNDGDLDLFLAQWGMSLPMTRGIMARPRSDSMLLINQTDSAGRTVFTNETEAFGLTPTVHDNYFIGAAFGDYDNDGFADLFLSSPLRKTSVLLHNVRGTRFEPTSLVARVEGGFVGSFVDVNHDGRLDLFESGFGDARSCTQQAVFGEELDRFLSGHSTIFLQTDHGDFVEQRDFFDRRLPMSTMGANYGDLNNDGAFDFYLGTGTPEGWFVLPNLMYLGELQGTVPTLKTRNISMLGGFGTIQKGHGIVFFDFDDDGDQDIYSSLGGMWPGDAWPNQMFVNHSALENTWVKVRLRGVATNHFGIGAKIKVVASTENGESVIRYYSMDQKTGFGCAPMLAHVGLFSATRIDRIEVTWPVSGRTEVYDAEINSSVTLREGNGVPIGRNGEANRPSIDLTIHPLRPPALHNRLRS